MNNSQRFKVRFSALDARLAVSLGVVLCSIVSVIGQESRLQRELELQRQRLGSIEVEDRRDALMRLANLKRPEAARVAAAGLTDKSATVRVAAAHAVIWMPAGEAASLLIPMLTDKDEFVRREVAFAFGETRHSSAVSPLVDLLSRDKKPSVRASAAIALGQIGDDAAVPGLSQAITGEGKKRSKSAEDEFVVRSAVRSLGQIGSRSAVPLLIGALQNEFNSIDTRREAATALGLIGDPSAVPALQAAFQANADPYLSEAARLAIQRISLVKTKGAGN